MYEKKKSSGLIFPSFFGEKNFFSKKRPKPIPSTKKN